MPRGIFSLDEVQESQLSNDWSTRSDVLVKDDLRPFRQVWNYGYFAGGQNAAINVSTQAGFISSIKRLDMDSSTTSTVSSMGTPRGYFGAVTSTDAGYFCGGLITPHMMQYSGPLGGPLAPSEYFTCVSTVEKITYSNDTTRPSLKGNLNEGKFEFSTISQDNSFGYVCGGCRTSSSGPTISSFDNSDFQRVTYASDTVSSYPSNTPSNHKTSAASASSPTNAYLFGGSPSDYSYNVGLYPYSFKDDISRWSFANSTWNNTIAEFGYFPGNSSIYRGAIGLAAAGNGNNVYIGGGDAYGPSTSNKAATSVVQKFDYSNDTTDAVPATNLTGSRAFLKATANPDYGYFVSGGTQDWWSVSYVVSHVDRVDFSNDTATAAGVGYGSGVKGPAVISPRQDHLPGVNETLFDANAAGVGISTARTPTSKGMYFYGQTPSTPVHGTSAIDTICTVTDTINSLFLAPSPRYLGACVTDQHRGLAIYAGGRYTPSQSSISTVSKISYSNHSETFGANMPSVGKVFTLASPTHAYFLQGVPSFASTVNRYNYSTDTFVGSFNLAYGPSLWQQNGAMVNDTHGYFIGGSLSGPYGTMTSDSVKVQFSNDTTSTISGILPLKSKPATSCSVSNSIGYAISGSREPSFTKISTIDKINFSNDTAFTLPSSYITTDVFNATENHRASFVGNGCDNVYVQGDQYVTKFNSSNETVNALTSNLMNTRKYRAGSSAWGGGRSGLNGPNGKGGYIGGGYDQTTYGGFNTAEPFDFNTPGKVVASNTCYFTGGSMGGSPITYNSIITKLDFSNETTTSRMNDRISNRTFGSGGSSRWSSTTKGYFAGYLAPSAYSWVSRISYSSDTMSMGPGGLNQPETLNYYFGQSSSTHGYQSGGFAPAASPYRRSNTHKLSFSTESFSPTPGANLPSNLYLGGSCGNLDYGIYSNGTETGANASQFSSIHKIDFSNDTITGSVANTALNCSYTSSTANKTNAYLTGFLVNPNIYSSTVEKYSFANDTVSPISYRRTSGGSMATGSGNQQNGYFGGGNYNSSFDTLSSWIDRIDYDNDTSILSNRAFLSAPIRQLSSTGAQDNCVSYNLNNTLVPQERREKTAGTSKFTTSPVSNYAFVFGGKMDTSNTDISSAYRIDFNNDTVSAGIRGTMDDYRARHSALYDATGGKYFIGAGLKGPSLLSTSSIATMNVSNETFSSSPSNWSPVTHAGYSGTYSNGYLLGGLNPGNAAVSTIQKIQYSNSTVDDAYTNADIVFSSGTASKDTDGDYSIFFMGWESSNIMRLSTSTTTTTTTAANMLTPQRYGKACTGNASYTYWAGGWASPNRTSAVDRHMTDNDTYDTLFRGPLNAEGHHFDGATSGDSTSSDYAYWIGRYDSRKIGGQSGQSIIERLDYSNDSCSPVIRGSLPVDLWYTTAGDTTN